MKDQPFYLPPVRTVLVWASVRGSWLIMWIPLLAVLPLTWIQRLTIFFAIIGAWYGGYLAGFSRGFRNGGRAYQGYLIRHWNDELAQAFTQGAKQRRQDETKPS